jgi:hypothetical protein
MGERTRQCVHSLTGGFPIGTRVQAPDPKARCAGRTNDTRNERSQGSTPQDEHRDQNSWLRDQEHPGAVIKRRDE